MVRPTLLRPSTRMMRSINLWPSMGSSALGRPIRLDSPAERTTPIIMGVYADLFVNFIDETTLFQFPDDAVVDDILDPQSSAGLSPQCLFDLHLGSFPGNQWDAIVQLHVGCPG